MKIDCRPVAWCESQRATHRVHVASVNVISCCQILRITITFDDDAGETGGKLVAHRDIDEAFMTLRIEVAKLHLEAAFEAVGGLVGPRIDQAARGVAPEQCALRAAHDRHRLHVEKFDRVEAVRLNGDVVDVHADARIRTRADGRIAYASNLECARREVALTVGDVGYRQLHVRRVFNLLALHLVCANRRNRDGRFLNRPAEPRGDDDDLFDHYVVGFLRQRGGRRQCDDGSARPRANPRVKVECHCIPSKDFFNRRAIACPVQSP